MKARCLMCGAVAAKHPTADCDGLIPRGSWWERALVAVFNVHIPVPWR